MNIKLRGLWMGISLVLAGSVLIVFSVLAAPSAKPASQITGKVILQDGSPAEGAWVRPQTSDALTYADMDGSFMVSGLTEGITVTLTAWYPGHKTGWIRIAPPAGPLTITMKPYDTRDNKDYVWNTSYPDPANLELGCGHCMSPSFDEWQHTAHAASGTNPRFFSLYNGTDLTGTQTVAPGYLLDFPSTAGNCATCHAPGAAADAPFTTHMNDLEGVNQEGVFCEFCHKVGAVYLNPANNLPYPNSPGVISMRLYRPYPGDQLFFGSLDDVNRRVSYLPLEQSSQFCAPCHQFSFWGTPIYESYREWLESPYPGMGIECQTCHMPAGDTPYFVLPEQGGLARNPNRLASHKDLGIKDTEFLQDSIALEVSARQEGKVIWVSTAITNTGAGHHYPTDHPGRHLILTLDAQDMAGTPLEFVKGSTVPEWGGEQAGEPGLVYAKILQDVQSGEYPVVSYWKQALILADNRLPAFGSDQNTFLFMRDPFVTGVSDTITITARLVLRRSFADDMVARGWQEPDILLAEQQIQLTLNPIWSIYLPNISR